MPFCNKLLYVALCLLMIGSQALAQQVKIGLSRIAGGLINPTVITHAGDGSGRLFIAESRPGASA